jgi:ribonucleoside-diphosphate reductase beta chain
MPQTFRSTSAAGLDHRSPPMRLWHKAKKLGTWDPRDIDFTQDARDWARLSDEERDVLLRLTSLFQAGEESVTMDLLPLIMVIAGEGRLEEEMYLTSFLWEEAKHVEAFRRFLDEVAGERTDLSRFHTPSYLRIFTDELPAAMGRLRVDASPAAQATASVTYNMIVEGVLAETGYHAYDRLLQRNGLMPGMQQVVTHLRRDEARHIAYGVYLLSRLVAEHGDPVWEAVEARLEQLLEPALGVVGELFAAYDEMPFGLRLEEFSDFALSQFGKRVARLERARGQTLAQVDGERLETEEDAAA